MKNPSLIKHAATVGAFGVLLYAACLLWRLTITDPLVAQHHLLDLKLVFPGFAGYDSISILWGAFLSFVYFMLGSIAYHSLHCGCECRNKK